MFHEKTIHELRDMLKNKEVSSEEITKSYLDRIDKIDPAIESYISVSHKQALEDANKADMVIREGKGGDLTGIPMAIKDNICTKGVATTCGSHILEHFVPPYDATVTKKLKSQSAVILGKLNMDEFAMGSSTETSYFKRTKNPYDLSRVPGGSSGGSAASVSADLATFSLGSDTGGSIRQPASLCGVIGMKPTYGSISRFGLVAFASSLDQIGPFTKDVEDCAIVLNTLMGYDKMDSTSAKVDYPDFKKALIPNMKGLKVGIPEEYFGEGISSEVLKKVQEALDILRAQGAQIGECSLPLTKYALPAYYLISSAEASSNLARFDGIKYGFRAKKYSDLLDLYKQTRSEGFGAEVKRRIMLGSYALSSGYYDAYYKKAQQVRTLIMNDFNKSFEKFDVIVTPTTPTTAFKFGEKAGDPIAMYMADVCTVAVNIAGLPGLSMPCGLDSNGLPVGLQIIGKAFDEPTVLQTAYSFEQATNHHKTKPLIKGGE